MGLDRAYKVGAWVKFFSFIFCGSLLWACAPDQGPIEDPSSSPTIDQLIQAELAKRNDDHPGRALYQLHCASCHDNGLESGGVEAPNREAMALQGSEAIARTLAFGVMQVQAEALTPMERRTVAEYLGDPTAASAEDNVAANLCLSDFDPGQTLWSQWGGDKNNRRQAPHSTLSRDDIANLELQWAFAFPGAARARSQPAATTTALFTGSQSGLVYALDRGTGCIHWTFTAKAEVRVAPVIESTPNGDAKTLYFGDFDANVYAIDARDGSLLWETSVKDHPAGTITGSPVYHNGRVFVPMSSTEVVNAYTPSYECCTFRGGITALDAGTGGRLWRMYTVDEPQPRGLNSVGANRYGPSGVPIWNSPTIDVERGLLYAGTGENYSSPATDLSDAILAISMETGELVWATQTIEGDAWNAACGPYGTSVNCPEEDGPDFDFGAPPILTTAGDGRDWLLAGQKSGMIYGLDPNDKGRLLWAQRKGMGGFNGGIHWGMAVKDDHLFVGIADTPGNRFTVGENRQGMHVKNIVTEETVWSVLEPDTCDDPTHYCRTALSSPPTVTETAVFAGTLNGRLIVYDIESGETLWRYNTLREFDAVNGISGKGGSIDSAGIVAIGDQIISNSGYDKFGQIAGNVLLVFAPNSQQESP